MERMKTTMQKYEIINLKLKGWSTNKIHKTYGVSRDTIRKYWTEYQTNLSLLCDDNSSIDKRNIIETIIDDPHYDVSNRKPRKYSEEIDVLLDQILENEKLKDQRLGPNHKQKLTQKQIHELIVKEGHDIGLTTIQAKIHEKLDKGKEAYIRQEYNYGDRFEYDFGEVKLIINGKQTKGFLAVLTANASGFRWAYLYHNSKMDVFLDSQVRFFEMLGGCFKEGVYDNMRNVVSKFIGRNNKELNKELIKLATYYGFSINVTNCFSGNEKGFVEESVKFIRNKVFATRYEFDSFEEAASYLQDELVKLNKDSLIEEERKHLTFYRPKYETARIESLHVNKYSFIQVDTNFYSVPDSLVDKYVTVKIYPDIIDIYYKTDLMASHYRSNHKKETHIDIRHYLNTFLRKPGALRNSQALKSVPELEELFNNYFKEKPKEFIDILYVNSNRSIEEIIEKIKIDVCLSPLKDNWIAEACDKQLNEISKLFVGGTDGIH